MSALGVAAACAMPFLDDPIPWVGLIFGIPLAIGIGVGVAVAIEGRNLPASRRNSIILTALLVIAIYCVGTIVYFASRV